MKWLGASLVALAVLWLLTRRITPPSRRLALRCLGASAALTPQPLWAPGEGAATMPALSLLAFGRAPLFSYAMGLFPILAVGALLFTVWGWRPARAAGGGERLFHQATRRWSLVGVVLPLLVLAATSPFLAFFLFGGPIAVWGTVSLLVLGGAAVLDWRAARQQAAEVEPRWLRRASHALAALLVVAAVAFQARRLGAWQ